MINLRIADAIFNRPLMIAEDKLNVILHVLGPKFHLDLSNIPTVSAAVLSEEARARSGYRVENGIAVIGVYGPLMHRILAGQFPSGGPTTYSELRRAFATAMADDGVAELKFEIDSPGGDSSGCFDLAEEIYLGRATKPSTAVVNEKAFSAGYLIAAACSRIVLPRTGGVGSVGVIATHADLSKAEEEAGIKVTHVIYGARKADWSPHAPLSKEAFDAMQEMVDETGDLFVETIARYRGLSAKDVKATEAGIFFGKKAIAMGLADEIAPADQALSKRTSGPGGKAPADINKGVKSMNRTELKEQHPALYAEVFEEGKKAGSLEASNTVLTAERSRVAAILDIPGPAAKAHHGLLIEGIKTGLSAGDVSLAINGKEAEFLGAAGQALKNGATPPAPPAEAGNVDEVAAQAQVVGDVMEAAAKSWQTRN